LAFADFVAVVFGAGFVQGIFPALFFAVGFGGGEAGFGEERQRARLSEVEERQPFLQHLLRLAAGDFGIKRCFFWLNDMGLAGFDFRRPYRRPYRAKD